MNLKSFWTKDEQIPLLRAIERWAGKRFTIENRLSVLANSGVSTTLINELYIGNPQEFASTLVAKCIGNYSFSVREPNYHPMIKFLQHLCDLAEQEIGYLPDEDFALFNQIAQKGQEKLKVLRCRSAVGRIESPKGEAIGTGFLVCKDLLLTCYHVLRDRSELWVRFNYNDQNRARDTDAFVTPIDLNFVKYSGINDLDYALVRLKRQPPQVVISLSQKEINQEDKIRMIHHPKGDLATVSPPGEITEVGRLLLHNLPTEHGSSGAPIFNQNWEVIAIHRGNPGITAARPTDKMTGIPIEVLRYDISSIICC